jgi:predicted MPP superfamily phosphohydrolase
MTRRSFLKRASLLGGTLIAPTLLLECIRQAQSFVTRHYRLPLPDLPSAWIGARLAFVSDFHHTWYFGQDKLQKAVDTLHTLAPDLILLGGDYVDYHTKPRDYLVSAFEILKQLKAREGVFGVLGNHDAHENLHFARKMMIEAGISDLSNQFTRLTRKGDVLRVAGLSEVNTEVPRSDRAEINKRQNECTLLLTHNPDVFEHMKMHAHYSFAFAGHTHGGQVYIPGIGAPVMSSAFGQKYRYGFVKTYTGTVYVTSGYGHAYVPVRLFCDPEICLFTLERGDLRL